MEAEEFYASEKDSKSHLANPSVLQMKKGQTCKHF